MTYAQRIKAAHSSGHLFAHMFESSLEENGPETGEHPLKNLFDVMAKKPGAVYHNSYDHHYKPSRKHGITGLASTAVNERYPVALYTENSNVGLLMDSAKPIIVSPGDAYSVASTEGISFAIDRKTYELFPDIYAAQRFNCPMDRTSHYVTSKQIDDSIPRAEAALPLLWKCIEEIGHDNAPAMNEISIAAQLGDVCGIVVHKGDLRANQPSFEDSLVAAKNLKRYLLEHYPKQVDASLPIVTYELARSLTDPTKKPQITPMDDTQIEAVFNAKKR